MLSLLEKEKGYRFILKDATGVENYPVAVFIAVNMKQCTEGLKLGAHPQYEIAMERSMTEARGLRSAHNTAGLTSILNMRIFIPICAMPIR